MRKVYLVPYGTDGKGGVFTIGDIPQIAALRPAVLYWDEVTVPIPYAGMLPILDGHLSFLERAGAVKTYAVKSDNVATGMADFRLFSG